MNSADLRTAIICRWLLQRRPRARGNPRWRLGIYKADRLGDFVLAVGAIRRLVEAAGAHQTVLIVTQTALELAAREFPGVDLVVVDPCRSGAGAAGIELWRRRDEELFRFGVQHLVCLRHHRLPAESVICGGIPAAVSWGMANSELPGAAGRLATMPLDRVVEPLSADRRECLELAGHRAVVGAYLGASIEPGELTPMLTPEWGASGSMVVVSPYGSKSIRDIPRHLLAAAGRHLRAAHGLRMNLLSPPGEVTRFTELGKWLTAAGVEGVGLTPCATHNDLREALRRSRLVLSAETGTAHQAVALDAPLVALLGGGHIGWFAPWSRSGRQQWLNNDVSCRGCLWVCSQPSPVCLTDITEDRVVQAIDVALTASG